MASTHIESLPEMLTDNCINIHCPQGKAGDRLWVRENFKIIDFYEGYESGHIDDFAEGHAIVSYKDGANKDAVLSYNVPLSNGKEVDEIEQARRAFKKKTVPSIHMPRWASRINLEITGIRVERLNDISEEDSIAEGIGGVNGELCDVTGIVAPTHKDRFKNLWESINGAGSWDENPWLWVIEFKKMGVK